MRVGARARGEVRVKVRVRASERLSLLLSGEWCRQGRVEREHALVLLGGGVHVPGLRVEG